MQGPHKLTWAKAKARRKAKLLLIPSRALAIDSFLVPCATSSAMLLPSLARPLGMEASSNGFLLLGSSIADDIEHDTKKGSIARVQKGIKC